MEFVDLLKRQNKAFYSESVDNTSHKQDEFDLEYETQNTAYQTWTLP